MNRINSKKQCFTALNYLVVIYIDMLLYSVLVERILQDLVVLNVLIIEFGSPLHFGKIECSWVY